MPNTYSTTHIIRTPDQMPKAIHWKPMDPDWRKRVDENQLYNNPDFFDPDMLTDMKALHDKILTFGGDEVCMSDYDYDAQKILERGQFYYGSSDVKKGLPNRCHYNAARLWKTDPDNYRIATGYALSEDGLWRCHSWIVQTTQHSVRILETTVKRVAYFGFVMNEEECEDFFACNG